MQVDKEDGRTWQTPGKLSFCARILQSGLYSVQGENWRRAGRSTGSPGGNEVLSVNPCLLGFNPRLKQGLKPEQGWRCKAEILLSWLDNGNGCARAVCQVEQKMLHAKTFSDRIKGLLELKCRLLTGKRKKINNKTKKSQACFRLCQSHLLLSLCFLCIHQPHSLLYPRCFSSSPLAWCRSWYLHLAPGTLPSVLPGRPHPPKEARCTVFGGDDPELTVTRPCSCCCERDVAGLGAGDTRLHCRLALPS